MGRPTPSVASWLKRSWQREDHIPFAPLAFPLAAGLIYPAAAAAAVIHSLRLKPVIPVKLERPEALKEPTSFSAPD